ncbi:MAG TPA: 6-hydroxymethylpterin diphosphokinase MptE-like protein [Bacillota bacterium]|nr:6-hydroxymethylpterin diphosphokinase MptE-like protein [Bacillota bacterium]
MYYQNNLRIVKARFPHLLPLLKEANQTVTFEIQPSKTGVPVARVNQGQRKLWLNSVYNPEAEAERWAETLTERTSNARTLILCGSGFLYHLKAIVSRRRFDKIVCYEPNPLILRAVMEEVDLEELREVDFLWISGVDHPRNAQLTSEYLTSLILDMTLEVVSPYQELYGVEIAAFQEKLAEWVRFNRCNLATMNLFSEQWLENYIQNLPHLSYSPGVRHFFQQFKGVPGIIVSAGPSLEKNLHLLKELRERAVIICAGTTLHAMAKQEVFPHFLALIDGGVSNKNIFGLIDHDFMKQIHLIYNGRVNWEFLNDYPGLKIYAKLDAETFSDYLSLRMQNYDFGMIKSGFSVSHTALDLANKLGCDPIILIGQDLAYTGDKRYADSTNQNVISRDQLPRGFFVTKDIYGQNTVTNREFDNFRMLFETQIAENYRNKNIINATEGGLNIKGMVNRKLQEVITEYCRVDWGVSQKVESIYNIGRKAVQKCLPDQMFLTREIKTLARLGDKKAAELWERVELLRRHRILDGYTSEQLDAELRQVSADYKSLLNIREYQLLTKDLHQAKLAANEIALQRIADRKEIEIYREKLQYWLNIFTELRSYFKFIIQLCKVDFTQEVETTPADDLKMLIPSGTQLEEIVKGFRNGGSLAETGRLVESVINQKLIEPGAHVYYFYYYAMLLMKKKLWDKALIMFEQALALNERLPEIPFLMAKAYYATETWSKK